MGGSINKIKERSGNSDAMTNYSEKNQDSNPDNKNNYLQKQQKGSHGIQFLDKPNKQMKLDATVKNIKNVHNSVEIDQCISEETSRANITQNDTNQHENLSPYRKIQQGNLSKNIIPYNIVFQSYTDLKSVREYNQAISKNQHCIIEKESDEESDISSKFPVINDDVIINNFIQKKRKEF